MKTAIILQAACSLALGAALPLSAEGENAARASIKLDTTEVMRDTIKLPSSSKFAERTVVVLDSAQLFSVKVYAGSDTALQLVYEGQFTDKKSYEKWEVVANNFSIPLLDNILEGRGANPPAAKKTKPSRKFEGHYAGFGFGLAEAMNSDFSSMTMRDGFTFDMARSTEWTFNIVDASVPFGNTGIGLVSGFGMRWRNLRFDDQYRLQKSSDGSIFLAEDANGTVYSKSRLRTLQLTVPLLLEAQQSKNFYTSIGLSVGWNVMASNMLLWEDESGEHKSVVKSGWQVNPLSMDFMARLGFHGFSLYSTLPMTSLFRHGMGVEARVCSVGLMIDF